MHALTEPSDTTARALIDRHACIFLDAYGVLNDGAGVLPHAPRFIAELNARGREYLVLTNDASRLPATLEARFARMGLAIPRARILSSGELLAPYFARESLRGARCAVLGTDDSRAFVRDAGGEVLPFDPSLTLDAVVVCDDSGYDFLPAIESVLSMAFRTLDAGREPALILPNPDLIYPKDAHGRFGLTAGTVANMLEAAIALRYPRGEPPRFVRLGKPYAPIFEAAVDRVGTRDCVMVGDQLFTDIQGANDFGIPSALIGTGLTPLSVARTARVRPTYLLPSLALE